MGPLPTRISPSKPFFTTNQISNLSHRFLVKHFTYGCNEPTQLYSTTDENKDHVMNKKITYLSMGPKNSTVTQHKVSEGVWATKLPASVAAAAATAGVGRRTAASAPWTLLYFSIKQVCLYNPHISSQLVYNAFHWVAMFLSYNLNMCNPFVSSSVLILCRKSWQKSFFENWWNCCCALHAPDTPDNVSANTVNQQVYERKSFFIPLFQQYFPICSVFFFFFSFPTTDPVE